MNRFSKDGVEYFQLVIPCPSCLEKGLPTQTMAWTHAKCGGDMYVGENAFYYCKTCGHTAPVLLWAYSCPNHHDGEFYKIKDGKFLLNAMVVGAEICKQDGGVKFMRKFTAAFDEWMDENPDWQNY